MLYRIDLGGVAQRELRLTLDVPVATLDLHAGRTELFLPVWTPGSYLVREYAQHVSAVSATDEDGRPLAVTKRRKNRWAVEVGASRTLRVAWRVYAHELTVRTSHATRDFAFWNGACVALWPVGQDERRAAVEVALPDGWQLFAGSLDVQRREPLEPGGAVIARFDCRDLDELVDTPCLAGRLASSSFVVGEREHRFVPAGLAGIEPPPSFGGDLQRIVETTADLFHRELPFERYSFLALFGAAGRGGLEHADSSVLLAPRTTFKPRAAYEDFLALVAHEYLHAWNVKRMRPRELWKLDYEAENYTRLLWVAEGFTAYYDDLIVRRAGLSTPAAYLERLASHVTAWRGNPGRRAQSLGDASFDAWMLLYRPGENTRNVTQNYYTNGALAALVFDAEIRRCSGGARSLDDALRELWQRTWRSEPPRGFELDDVIAAIDSAAGTPLGQLVRDTVEAAFEPDLDRALGLFGLRVQFADGEHAFVGARFRAGETTVASVERDTPGWHAGLCPGDELIAVDGLRVRHDTWQAVWDHVARPGLALHFLIAREGVVREIEITPTARDDRGTKIVSIDEPSESQLAHREAWLGARELRG